MLQPHDNHWGSRYESVTIVLRRKRRPRATTVPTGKRENRTENDETKMRVGNSGRKRRAETTGGNDGRKRRAETTGRNDRRKRRAETAGGKAPFPAAFRAAGCSATCARIVLSPPENPPPRHVRPAEESRRIRTGRRMKERQRHKKASARSWNRAEASNRNAPRHPTPHPGE